VHARGPAPQVPGAVADAQDDGVRHPVADDVRQRLRELHHAAAVRLRRQPARRLRADRGPRRLLLGDGRPAAGRAGLRRRAAKDAKLRAAQDAVVDLLYFAPASLAAERAGLGSALGVAILYDTAIQHGNGGDHDGLGALIARTTARAHGTPADGVDEQTWLATFLRVRRYDLQHPHNRARRVDWPESVGRVDALARLLDAGETALTPPVRVNPWGDPRPFVLG
jgi:Glycosyl hydrolase family 46